MIEHAGINQNKNKLIESSDSWQKMIRSATKQSSSQSAYKMQVPDYYASLMDLDNPNCPIRLQALPNDLEVDPILPDWIQLKSIEVFGRPLPWKQDSIGDLQFLRSERLTHRYEDRAILHVTAICAMYCRFCFRKAHLNDTERKLYQGSLENAFKAIEQSQLREVILTGGDPLSLDNPQLEKILYRLQTLPTLKSIRIHTRMPVTLPYRIDDELVDLLQRTNDFRDDLQVQIVTHFNHPKELSTIAQQHLRKLIKIGLPIYNQSVLLRKINNDPDVLYRLFQTLYEWGVRPYYLHHPDWTPNTFHFRVSISEGQSIVRQLRGKLSGPAMPTYILDLPNGYGKQSLLDQGVTLKEKFQSKETGISGAIYEISGAHTRQGHQQIGQYLDLWPSETPTEK